MARFGLVLLLTSLSSCSLLPQVEEPERHVVESNRERELTSALRQSEIERNDAVKERDAAVASAAKAADDCAASALSDARRIAELETEKRAAIVEENKAEVSRFREEHKSDPPPLLCRDGSESGSCVCGGSRRGCCSSHGGVAGCAKR
jgi:hypothetical protein